MKPLKIELKACEDCGGSGICSACKGEGYVLKKRSEESAEKARKLSKNMATRFTDGYNLLTFLSSKFFVEFRIQLNFYTRQASKEVEVLHKVLFW